MHPPQKPDGYGVLAQGLQNLGHIDGFSGTAVECLYGPVDSIVLKLFENHDPLRSGSGSNAQDFAAVCRHKRCERLHHGPEWGK